MTGNYLRALSIQMPDLLLAFGTWGALVGAATAVLTPFVANLFGARDATAELIDSLIGGQVSLDSVRGTIAQLRDLQEQYTAAIEASAGASGASASAVAANSKREFEARKQILAVELELLRIRGAEQQANLRNLEDAHRRQIEGAYAPIGATIEQRRAMLGRTAGDTTAEREQLARMEYQLSRMPLGDADARSHYQARALSIRQLRAETELTELAAEEAATALHGEFLDVGGGAGGGSGGAGTGGSSGRRGGGGGGGGAGRASTPVAEKVREVGQQLQYVMMSADQASDGLADAFTQIVTDRRTPATRSPTWPRNGPRCWRRRVSTCCSISSSRASWAAGAWAAGAWAGAGTTMGLSHLVPTADGNAFAGGRVTPFARGGVVSAPTMFPMRDGVGLMGERGPEAILPLKRGRGGRLGVAAEGGAASSLSITVNVSGARGNAEIEEMVHRGVAGGLAQYDQGVLPARLDEIRRDPRRR